MAAAVRTTKKVACLACKKEIYSREADFVLEEYETGKVSHYHERCAVSAYAAAASCSGGWHLRHRYIEAEPVNKRGRHTSDSPLKRGRRQKMRLRSSARKTKR